MMKLQPYYLLVLFLLSLAPQGHAQTGVNETLSPNAFFEQSMRQKLPDFRLVSKYESFPERLNATLDLPIVATSNGQTLSRVLVTLHDGTSGAPLETCYAPCTLHKPVGRDMFAVAYKSGYAFGLPHEMADPDVMRSRYEYWDGEYEVNPGLNMRRAVVRRKMCEREFELSEKADADATPCYRIPPPVPQVEFSGYCLMNFDISAQGDPFNIRIADCTAPDFESISEFIVSIWKYHPKVERGQAVERFDVETRLRYEVTDFDETRLDQTGQRVPG